MCEHPTEYAKMPVDKLIHTLLKDNMLCLIKSDSTIL